MMAGEVVFYAHHSIGSRKKTATLTIALSIVKFHLGKLGTCAVPHAELVIRKENEQSHHPATVVRLAHIVLKNRSATRTNAPARR
jgi:hypothetical protein